LHADGSSSSVESVSEAVEYRERKNITHHRWVQRPHGSVYGPVVCSRPARGHHLSRQLAGYIPGDFSRPERSEITHHVKRNRSVTSGIVNLKVVILISACGVPAAYHAGVLRTVLAHRVDDQHGANQKYQCPKGHFEPEPKFFSHYQILKLKSFFRSLCQNAANELPKMTTKVRTFYIQLKNVKVFSD
jgi:hypothetical protein